MTKQIQDLPVDPSKVDEDAIDFFENGAADIEANAVLVLAQLDPLELVDGQPRWTNEQRDLILNASTLVSDWEN